MKRWLLLATAAAALLAILAGLAFLVIVSRDPPPVPGPPAATEEQALEGVWTLVYTELAGEYFSSVELEKQLINLTKLGPGNAPGRYIPEITKISKEEIETGIDDETFPGYRYSYKLHPDGRSGAIDKIPLEQRWPHPQPKKMEGIYLLSGDFLIFCFNVEGGPRPERFTTSKNPRTALTILRRGKLSGSEQAEEPKKVYQYKEDLTRLVVVYRWPRTYIPGYLDASGKFTEDSSYAPKNGINEIPLAWLRNGIINVPRWSPEPVYEFRSGMLVEGVLQDSGEFVPTQGKKPIPFKEYQCPGARRIYNLPGEFVPVVSPTQKRAAGPGRSSSAR